MNEFLTAARIYSLIIPFQSVFMALFSTTFLFIEFGLKRTAEYRLARAFLQSTEPVRVR